METGEQCVPDQVKRGRASWEQELEPRVLWFGSEPGGGAEKWIFGGLCGCPWEGWDDAEGLVGEAWGTGQPLAGPKEHSPWAPVSPLGTGLQLLAHLWSQERDAQRLSCSQFPGVREAAVCPKDVGSRQTSSPGHLHPAGPQSTHRMPPPVSLLLVSQRLEQLPRAEG